MIIPVILCGGSGTRLWPLSRNSYPKQLLALTGEDTMLQQTVGRLAGLEDVAPPLVICNEEHRFLVAEQLRASLQSDWTIILEPIGRNTAPAAALASLYAMEKDRDALILVLPADHLIKDEPKFIEAVQAAAYLASQGYLATFGITPTAPETGYGYIKKGEVKKLNAEVSKRQGQEPAAYLIDRFVEKPDLATATDYVGSHEYLWNSGMFLFGAEVFWAELESHAPKMALACQQAYSNAVEDLDFLRLDAAAFLQCPSDSIDYAVMEKTTKGVVVPVDPGWNDIGSWSALWEVGKRDENDNVIHGDVAAYNTSNSLLHAESRLLATVGLTGHVVVETADAVLVAAKEHVQDVKHIVGLLKKQGRSEINLHRRVFRPWGSYEGVTFGDRFQVKLISVNPGAVLSLQMHHHRAEHWVVVKGTAKITKGEEVFVVSENESTFIPLGVTHRLENPGVIPLELIEVQSGSYLGEDDIVRFEDNYGRF